MALLEIVRIALALPVLAARLLDITLPRPGSGHPAPDLGTVARIMLGNTTLVESPAPGATVRRTSIPNPAIVDRADSLLSIGGHLDLGGVNLNVGYGLADSIVQGSVEADSIVGVGAMIVGATFGGQSASGRVLVHSGGMEARTPGARLLVGSSNVGTEARGSVEVTVEVTGFGRIDLATKATRSSRPSGSFRGELIVREGVVRAENMDLGLVDYEGDARGRTPRHRR